MSNPVLESRPVVASLKSIRILGRRVDAVSFSEAVVCARGFLAAESPHHVITVNTLMLLTSQQDPELSRIIDAAALAVPESWGILWASRRYHHPLVEFTPGIDLMQAFCRLAQETNRSVFLLGGKPGVAESAAASLKASYPGLDLAGVADGYFLQRHEEAAILEKIRAAQPGFLFVGLNMPQQEKWIAQHLPRLGVPIAMGVGGSFDVLSGRLRRAPLWMRRAGVEWVYRILQEPWRWRRIAQLPVFLWKVWIETYQ